ncbi:hypothetical protein EF902_29760 [Streptomyces sp. WAC05858]|nr:hypothetical protein EF902_29760 [Streptomyces sp. WAC05858]
MGAFSPDSSNPGAPGPLAWAEPADGQSVTAQVIRRLHRPGAGGGWWRGGASRSRSGLRSGPGPGRA